MTEINQEMSAAQMLKDARTNGRRKREISTISKLLCIREEYLTALEEGDYAAIPESVYVLGFARNYALELGLNPDEIIEKIKRETNITVFDKDDDDVKSAEELIAEPTVKRVTVWQSVLGHWKLIAGIVFGVLVLGGLLLWLLMPSADKDIAIDHLAETPVVSTTFVAPEYAMPVREEFGTENRESAKKIIQATGESWVKIEDGRGNTEFSRVLVAGDVYYVPTDKVYKATFGNAGVIDVWANGESSKPGAANARVTVDL